MPEQFIEVVEEILSQPSTAISGDLFRAQQSGNEGGDQCAESLVELAKRSVLSLQRLNSINGMTETSLYSKLESNNVVVKGEWVIQASIGHLKMDSLVDEIAKELAIVSSSTRTYSSEKADHLVSLIHRAARLEQHGLMDAALDLIYDGIDELLQAGRFAWIDIILLEVQVKSSSIDVLLALLTATSPARSRLSARKLFFQRVRDRLKSVDENDPRLLEGLEE